MHTRARASDVPAEAGGRAARGWDGPRYVGRETDSLMEIWDGGSMGDGRWSLEFPWGLGGGRESGCDEVDERVRRDLECEDLRS